MGQCPLQIHTTQPFVNTELIVISGLVKKHLLKHTSPGNPIECVIIIIIIVLVALILSGGAVAMFHQV